MISKNVYVSNDKYETVKRWMSGTIRGFQLDHGAFGRVVTHFDVMVISVAVDEADKGYYGFTKDVELWQSQWETGVVPLDLQIGDLIRVGFNQIGVPVVVERL